MMQHTAGRGEKSHCSSFSPSVECDGEIDERGLA